MPPDDRNLLESIIHFTGERDKKSLIRVLVEVLSDLIDFEALIFLRVPNDATSTYLESAASIPERAHLDKLTCIADEYGNQHVKLDESTSLCVSSREIVTQPHGTATRIVFPVVVNNAVTGVLDIYGHQHTATSEKLIRSFIRIYSNFLAIIDDNEHDTLTGLLNRKTFDAQLTELISDMDIKHSSFKGDKRRSDNKHAYHWIGILDIDHFKAINDNFGHVYGDEVLLLFSDLVKKSFRSQDLLFRYGGEEFVVVLTPCLETDAIVIFDRFRKQLESYDFPQVGKVTVSIGIAKLDSPDHTNVLEHADQSLYYAKEHGRNQVRNYHDLIKEGLLKARNYDGDIELF
jgi:diguanylate cyclase (GGDEF)-like protein